jgi:hypothetical protein
MLLQDAFGFGLGQEQEERVGGVGDADVEQPHGDRPPAQVHPQLNGRVSGCDHLCADPQSGQHLQCARLDRECSRLVRTVELPIYEPEPRAERSQLRRQGQSGGSGADHQHVNRSGDLTLCGLAGVHVSSVSVAEGGARTVTAGCATERGPW